MKHSKVITREREGEILTEALGADSVNFLLIARDGSSPPTLPFDIDKVFGYCTEYCAGGNDCPDGEFPEDCTHFACHALSKSGILVNLPSATCTNGVCIRVVELAAAFYNSCAQYSNVTKLVSHSDTQRGDYCFIPSWFGLSKNHVMLLADTANASGAKVYAHTNDRCGEYVDFDGQECSYYRISG